MRGSRSSFFGWLGLTLAVPLLLAWPTLSGEPEAGATASIKVRLSAAEERVKVERDPAGSYWFVIVRDDGRIERLTPDQLAARVVEEQSGRSWWLNLLNITSPAGMLWVALGLAGQLLFTGRMLVQWLTSERLRRSVVPSSFWWLSLSGATLLVLYFIWRRDLVGVLGQGVGWVVYLRNLWLIYRRADPEPA
ncbi:MAG TPA: lipid-A-disaccharide synthase N-terminal domain-containing protein [Thermoanaerobaculia bacterium]|nr:lipid-A-disaccharide synthase N-terminal domain-containing protein [Thermoanaerobaculia bacterium]